MKPTIVVLGSKDICSEVNMLISPVRDVTVLCTENVEDFEVLMDGDYKIETAIIDDSLLDVDDPISYVRRNGYHLRCSIIMLDANCKDMYEYSDNIIFFPPKCINEMIDVISDNSLSFYVAYQSHEVSEQIIQCYDTIEMFINSDEGL